MARPSSSTDANPEPSQGIEILLGSDNTVVRNRFEHYSDGLQINWGKRNYLGANTFTGNSIGVSVTGEDNVLDGNLIHGNRIGVALRPEPQVTATRLTPAQAHALYVGSRGVGAELAKQDQAIICDANGQPQPCQPLPNHNQPAPRLLALDGALLRGEVQGPASSRLRIEVFGNSTADGQEAEHFLGEVLANSDAQGHARFEMMLSDIDALHSFTATVTTADGATSELSPP